MEAFPSTTLSLRPVLDTPISDMTIGKRMLPGLRVWKTHWKFGAASCWLSRGQNANSTNHVVERY